LSSRLLLISIPIVTTPLARPWSGEPRAVIIINPAAHKLPSPKRRQEADRWLRAHGWDAEWVETTAPGHATRISREAAARGVDLVVVCGGDGTVGEAVNGLVGTETVLGTIPGGTSNIWAREAGLDKKPAEAVQLMVEGERRRVDLGRVGDRYYLLMAGFGIDAAVTENVSTRIKGWLGAAAYGIAAIRQAFTYKGKTVTIRIDGAERTLDVLMVLVGNTRLYAGITQIARDAQADDGLLDVYVYQGRGKIAVVKHAVRTLLGRHRKAPDVLYSRAREVQFTWHEAPLSVQVDGDALPETPANVTVAPSALWVALPMGFRSPLFRERPDPGPAAEPSPLQPGNG
jgi:diacylglycerol kinase (ATP)